MFFTVRLALVISRMNMLTFDESKKAKRTATSLFKSISILGIFTFLFLALGGCFSNHLQVDTLTKSYAVLSYDHGAMIPQVDENMISQKIREACFSGNYEVIDKEKKTTGQYRFRTKILFRCLDK